MVFDLLIGVIASLIASFLTGFFSNKLLAKTSSIILKVYTLFLSVYVFFVTSLVSVMFNMNAIFETLKLNEVNLFRFYSNTVNTLLFSLFPVAVLTGIIICAEIFHRSELREHKQIKDIWK